MHSYADCFLVMRMRNVISLLNYGSHQIMHAILMCQLGFSLLTVMLGVSFSDLIPLEIGLNILCVHGHWC